MNVALSRDLTTKWFNFQKGIKKNPSRARTSQLYCELYKAGVRGSFQNVQTYVRKENPKYRLTICHVLPCVSSETIVIGGLQSGNIQMWNYTKENNSLCTCLEMDIQMFIVKHENIFHGKLMMNIWKEYPMKPGMGIGVSITKYHKTGSMNFNVVTFEGEEEVSFSGRPAADFKESAKKARIVARSLASEFGHDDDRRPMKIEAFREQSPAGPSSGSLLCMMMLSLLMDKPIGSDNAFTGTIETDGTIGMIGGINGKYNVIKKAGIQNFFVPEGNVREIVDPGAEVIPIANASQLAKLLFRPLL